MGSRNQTIITRVKNRLIRALSGAEWDSFRASYEHERSTFKHTLIPRPWLNADSPPTQLAGDQIEVLEYDLRRYAHAVEKGLQLPERRCGFGRDKVNQVIRMMEFLRISDCATGNLYAWSLSILRQYADALVSDINSVKSSDEQCLALNDWSKELSGALDRLSKFASEESPCRTRANVWPAIYERRSVRRWTNRTVDDDTLRTLVDVGLWAPASCNRQPHKFLFVRDVDKVRLVTSLATGAKGFADQAPCILLLLSDVRAYYAPSERHLAYIDAALAGQNVALAAHDMGMGSVWLNWAIEDLSKEDALREALNIPEYYAIVALIALGYPDRSVECAPPVRRDVDDCIALDGMH